jgi:hypothetical protein
MPVFPNVPLAPGVPAIPRDPLAVAAGISLLTVDAVINQFLSNQTTWGIFLNGVPVVQADNITSMEFKQDWTLSTYPVEQGGFQSYDKVSLAYEVRLRFTTGGSISHRANFLESIQAVADTLTLYDVVTPEEIYTSVNIMRYDYDRKAFKGLGLFAIDVWLMQIRVTAVTQFQSVQAAPSASPQNVGQVQPETTNAQVQSAFTAFH